MIKVRVKFKKCGSMKFIGHLDVMRYFQKAIRRAEIDVAYSKGYSPHQLISFAQPLGVGLTSDGEYMDMQLNKEEGLLDIQNKLNQTMSEELQVVRIIRLPEESKTSMSLLAAADYLVSVKDGYDFCNHFEASFQDFVSRDSIIIIKKTKKSQQEIDLKEYIYAYAFHKADFEEKIGHSLGPIHGQAYENGTKVYLQLTCGSVHNIKPELVMEEFLKSISLEYNPYALQIHRLEMYTDLNAKKGEIHLNSQRKERRLNTLDSLGEC